MADLKNIEKCLVCGMDVKTDKIMTEYLEHTYYFCSEHDKKAFLDNPERYISKVVKAA